MPRASSIPIPCVQGWENGYMTCMIRAVVICVNCAWFFKSREMRG